MRNFEKISILGAGSWGTALANVFADGGARVLLYGRDSEVCRGIVESRENKKYLAGFPLSPAIDATTDLQAAATFGELVVNAIPVQSIRPVYRDIASQIGSRPILNLSKGTELGSLLRVSQVFAELCPQSPYAILSGPSFAEEVVRRLPTAVTVASSDAELAGRVQRTAKPRYFRCYTTEDVIGVELAGALKNVIAIATGLVDGLQLGFNAQAAVINRGLVEMTRFAVAMGASPMTFLGLAGVGDLVLTCTGPLSRNRRLGNHLAQGLSLAEARSRLGGVAEGVYTTESANALAQAKGLDLPILASVLQILQEKKRPREVLEELMSRELKEETLVLDSSRPGSLRS